MRNQMRKLPIFAFLAMAMFSLAVCAQTKKPIFREIDVSTVDKKRTIALGGDLKDNADILIKSGDLFVLDGNFGNTERLAIRVTGEGKVQEMIFDYRSDKDYEKTVANYTKDLGTPKTIQTLSSAIVTVRMVAWDDGKTRFEIVEVKANDHTIVSSALIDKNPK